jgi:hypothetical protein
MAVSVNSSNSQTAVISTEHTLGAAITAAGIYILTVDIANLVAGEIVELRAYGKARSSDTERLLFGPAIYGPIVPAQLLVYSTPVVSPHSVKFTLKQTAGTGRAFPWAIYSTGA